MTFLYPLGIILCIAGFFLTSYRKEKEEATQLLLLVVIIILSKLSYNMSNLTEILAELLQTLSEVLG